MTTSTFGQLVVETTFLGLKGSLETFRLIMPFCPFDERTKPEVTETAPEAATGTEPDTEKKDVNYFKNMVEMFSLPYKISSPLMIMKNLML